MEEATNQSCQGVEGLGLETVFEPFPQPRSSHTLAPAGIHRLSPHQRREKRPPRQEAQARPGTSPHRGDRTGLGPRPPLPREGAASPFSTRLKVVRTWPWRSPVRLRDWTDTNLSGESSRHPPRDEVARLPERGPALRQEAGSGQARDSAARLALRRRGRGCRAPGPPRRRPRRPRRPRGPPRLSSGPPEHPGSGGRARGNPSTRGEGSRRGPSAPPAGVRAARCRVRPGPRADPFRGLKIQYLVPW